jgi:hypothetical protein
LPGPALPVATRANVRRVWAGPLGTRAGLRLIFCDPAPRCPGCEPQPGSIPQRTRRVVHANRPLVRTPHPRHSAGSRCHPARRRRSSPELFYDSWAASKHQHLDWEGAHRSFQPRASIPAEPSNDECGSPTRRLCLAAATPAPHTRADQAGGEEQYAGRFRNRFRRGQE